jgi:outer membrane receptor protein involved in Fe transport
VNQNGPNGAYTISGAQSYDNQYTVDGAVIVDNIRGTPYNLFIEDAIQETTTSTSAISAEVGRFTGGVVNTITKSGGNTFSGSFRTTFTNDAWSATTPSGESRVQNVVPTYEATLGGPIWKDRVWFFASGRLADTKASSQTAFTNISYPTEDDEKRVSGKLTLTPFPSQTLTASYTAIKEDRVNDYFTSHPILDLDSLKNRSLPQDFLVLNYSGVVGSNVSLEGQYSQRHFTFEHDGSLNTDLVKGTVLIDESTGGYYNSPYFCGVCTNEKRDNQHYFAKGTWLLSTPGLGSHNIVGGFDDFAGKEVLNNYQSGSNYVVGSTAAIQKSGDLFPVFDSSSYILYFPITQQSSGSDVRTYAGFVNDQWRMSDRVSLNIGVRWDKNQAKDGGGVTRASDSAWSPRLGVTWDVTGRGSLRVAASYAKYVGAIQETQVGSATQAGTPLVLYWYYDGPGATPINTNPNGPLLSRAQALTQLFAWFQSQGCPNLSTCQVPLGGAQVPGVNQQILGSLASPSAREYSIGVQGNVGSRASYRVDVVRREYGDFYGLKLDTSTGHVSDVFGNVYDLQIVGNTNDLERNYTGLQAQFQVRPLDRLIVGASWTWSHTLGNFNGETAASGAVRGLPDFYPEYTQASWGLPRGDLAIDQRHRVRAYGSWDLPLPRALGVLSLGAIQAIDTGTPYGAAGLALVSPYVVNPGYVTPPRASTYYFTSRDAFRTDTVSRTDLSLNWGYRIADAVELFVHPQVINLFNNQAAIAVDTTILSAANASGFPRFNPFTTQPVQGVNWAYGPNFGKARNATDYQQPRTFLVSAGVRF